MNHLGQFGDHVSIPIEPDEDGFTGRECPQSDCEGYFKIEFGTGLKGENLPCHCPYCGHTSGHDHFWTKEQIEYAMSVAMRKITDAFQKEFKKLEFDHKPIGAFGIGLSMKVQPGRKIPIHYYREKQLETDVVCDHCTLRYSVYGVFAFCPDCGEHNSLQILDKNLEVVGKILDLALSSEDDVARVLIENSLEDCVSAFDGFGREMCRVVAAKTASDANMSRVSFQNLEGAEKNLHNAYGINLSAQVTDEEWRSLVRAFRKRHLIAHKLGVVDEDYIEKTADIDAVVGRRIHLDADDVRELLHIIRKLARNLSTSLAEAGNRGL